MTSKSQGCWNVNSALGGPVPEAEFFFLTCKFWPKSAKLRPSRTLLSLRMSKLCLQSYYMLYLYYHLKLNVTHQDRWQEGWGTWWWVQIEVIEWHKEIKKWHLHTTNPHTKWHANARHGTVALVSATVHPPDGCREGNGEGNRMGSRPTTMLCSTHQWVPWWQHPNIVHLPHMLVVVGCNGLAFVLSKTT